MPSERDWALMSGAQKTRYHRLQQTEPTVVKKLKCPEPGCKGKLRLKLSKYGRFYGCERWSKSQCQGAVAAHDDGTPRGKPVARKSRAKKRRQAFMQANTTTDCPSAWDRVFADGDDFGWEPEPSEGPDIGAD